MRAFIRSRGLFVAEFEPAEAELLSALASQVAQLLAERADGEPDPAIARLLPEAYPDDAEASAEFRRFTTDDLADRKIFNARQLAHDLAGASAATSVTKVQLGVQSASAWLKALTDIRLTIANRLGIENDNDVGSGEPALLDLYDWLGFVQGSLIDTVDK